MRLKVLGTGDGFSEHPTSFILEADKRYWIDCPKNLPATLKELGMDWTDIDNIILTHVHHDHTGDLPLLLQKVGFGLKKRVNLYTSRAVYESLERTLRPVVLSTAAPDGSKIELPLDNFVNFVELSPDVPYKDKDIEIRVRDNLHDIPTIGLKIRKGDRTLAYSGDTCFNPRYIDEQLGLGHITEKQSELLHGFLWDADMIVHEASSVPYYTHTWYGELEQLPEKIKEKLYVAHCPPDLPTTLKKLEKGVVYDV